MEKREEGREKGYRKRGRERREGGSLPALCVIRYVSPV